MRVSRIYFNGPLGPNTLVHLPLETSHYLLNVLRLNQNAPIILFNGEGGQYFAQLKGCDKKQAFVEIGEFDAQEKESFFRLHLVQAISRSEKMDWVIQKAVELGVHIISPVMTEFSSMKLRQEKFTTKMQHWLNIIISACEQSGRTRLPLLTPIQTLQCFAEKSDKETLKVLCDPHATTRLNDLKPAGKLMLFIGPEGGFSPKEIAVGIENGLIKASLGPRILRTETAALAALSIAQSSWGDL